jgi:hypothetical protein
MTASKDQGRMFTLFALWKLQSEKSSRGLLDGVSLELDVD